MRAAAEAAPLYSGLVRSLGACTASARGSASRYAWGTLLLQAFLVLAVAVAGAGGFAVVEHPAEPDRAGDEGLASIWRLEAVAALSRAPAAWRHRVLQGPLGQVTPKPTDLLVIGLPTLGARLRERADPDWQRPAGGPHIGRDGGGRWKTAALEGYPPRMCEGIAAAVVEAVACGVPARAATDADHAALVEFRGLAHSLHNEGAVRADFDGAVAARLPAAPAAWHDIC